MTDSFKKQKGRSHLLTKRLAECTEEEKAYKRAYTRDIKARYKARKTPDKCAEYNSQYGKQYYQLNREKLKALARQRQTQARQGTAPRETRGRKNLTGIVVV
jgi:hypothetical protein